MAHPVKIALVGMGWWGQKMLSVLQSAPEDMRQLCADKGIALSADYADALTDPAVEAVVLATPMRFIPPGSRLRWRRASTYSAKSRQP